MDLTFFDNFGPAENRLVSLAFWAFAACVVAVIFFVKYMGIRDGIATFSFVMFWVTAIAGVVMLVVGLVSETGRNDTVTEKRATQDLQSAGFDVVDVHTDASSARLRRGRCLWDYDLEKRSGQYVPVRGSGKVIKSPPVQPDEVGRDSPARFCERPM